MPEIELSFKRTLYIVVHLDIHISTPLSTSISGLGVRP
jgi:hypothetical protein